MQWVVGHNQRSDPSTLIMSSSEENYDLDNISGNESEGYSPVAKKKVGLTLCFWLLRVT